MINGSQFAKELYKIVRNKVKKLDDIQKMEEKLKEKGAKLTEDQAEKLKNKSNFMQSVQQSLEAFEIYKKTEYATIVAQRQANEAAEAAASAMREASAAAEKQTVAEEKTPEEISEMKQFSA